MTKQEPAFPTEAIMQMDGTWRGFPGMFLRDWFAGQFASIAAADGLRGYDHLCPETVKRTAARAYELADAMLEARK